MTTKIKCDQCDKQLNVDDLYPHNYGIRISSVDYGVNTSDGQYCVSQSPKIDSDKDFCGKKCLSKWLAD